MGSNTPAPLWCVNGQKFRFSWHAAQRALHMNVTADEIRAALTNPKQVVDSTTYGGSAYWTRGRVTLAVAWDDIDPEAMTVVTILWSTAELWADYYETGPAEGRDPRDLAEWRKHKEAVA